jgi:hypothetical protein
MEGFERGATEGSLPLALRQVTRQSCPDYTQGNVKVTQPTPPYKIPIHQFLNCMQLCLKRVFGDDIRVEVDDGISAHQMKEEGWLTDGYDGKVKGYTMWFHLAPDPLAKAIRHTRGEQGLISCREQAMALISKAFRPALAQVAAEPSDVVDCVERCAGG